MDDHPVVCAGLRAELGELPDVEVVGEAGDGRCALRLVKSRAPDVVLMDISMSGLNGLEATEQIRDQFPKVKVLILSVHGTEEYCWQALRAGASGYLTKSGTVAELPAAIRQVVAGETYFCPEISQTLRKNSRSRKGIALRTRSSDLPGASARSCN